MRTDICAVSSMDDEGHGRRQVSARYLTLAIAATIRVWNRISRSIALAIERVTNHRADHLRALPVIRMVAQTTNHARFSGHMLMQLRHHKMQVDTKKGGQRHHDRHCQKQVTNA